MKSSIKKIEEARRLEAKMRSACEMERTPEGWVILRSEWRNDDPHVCDDNWHRGPYWLYYVKGSSIREEGDCTNMNGDLAWAAALDRAMAAIKKAGYVGPVMVISTPKDGKPYEHLMGNESY